MRVSPRGPAHGFKASALDSQPGPGGGAISRLVNGAARLATPALNALLRTPGLSGLVLSTARAAVRADEAALDLDMTAWHEYDLDWRAGGAAFAVDGRPALLAPRPPRIPLGFVAWVDNYRAAAGGARRYGFDTLEVTHEQWMELQILEWSPA
jgi:hypothetical protein